MQIQKVLHDIPDPYKEVFMWRVFAEMSFKQIGQIFHKSENWACVTYHRARKMIKERLEADGYEK
jgi:RNA polymerase sigma-70 factor (ECF subfamily)